MATTDAPEPVASHPTETVRQQMPYAALLGIEDVRVDAGEVRATLQWAENLTTAGGILHGGVLMGLADSLGGYCAFLNLPEGASGTTTIESKTNFLRAVRSGAVEAVTRPLHIGRTVIVVDTEVRDPDGRLVARVTQTQAVLRA